VSDVFVGENPACLAVEAGSPPCAGRKPDSEFVWMWGVGSGTPIETNPVDVGIHLTQVSSTASNVAGLKRS
jgi:hypothetical protein